MNILLRDKQVEVIAALCDDLGIRAASRITGVNRGTVGALALRMGRGWAELHDRMMVGLRDGRRRNFHLAPQILSRRLVTYDATHMTPRDSET